GMAYQDNPRELQRVEHSPEIGGAGCQLIARARLARGPIASTGNREDMMVVGKLGGEVVESVRHVLKPGEEDERWPRAAPVEHLEPDSRGDGDEADLVRGGIGPRRQGKRHLRRGYPACDQQGHGEIQRSPECRLPAGKHDSWPLLCLRDAPEISSRRVASIVPKEGMPDPT